MVVSFRNYRLLPRFDGRPWTELEIYEAATSTGPWLNKIDTQSVLPPANDPTDPEPYSFTTEKGTIQGGWYMVVFLDADGDSFNTEPVQNRPANEILCSLDDINANLDGEIIEATPDNSDLVQISVARVVRGYLSRIVDQMTLYSWTTPDTTPDIIREVAAKFCAAQIYYNEISRTSIDVSNTNYAQRKYDEAMALLQAIIAGDIIIYNPSTGQPIIIDSVDVLSLQDYFPVDDTDRAFTLSMEL
jgi:hypothetical protein